MRCPFCHHPTFEREAECGSCGLSLAKADRMFGTVPRMTAGVTDHAGLFSQRQRRSVLRTLSRFHNQFPQLRAHVFAASLRPDHPLGVYAFWIFNRGGLCQDLERGGRNRTILLTLDPAQRRANLMVGYGLEPFVSPDHLARSLQSAQGDFANGRFADGITHTFNDLADQLVRISSTIDQTYGVSLEQIFRSEITPANAGDY